MDRKEDAIFAQDDGHLPRPDEYGWGKGIDASENSCAILLLVNLLDGSIERAWRWEEDHFKPHATRPPRT